jgi:hypothetical protein
MSLSIRLNGQVVDLAPNPRVAFDLLNPFLTYDSIPGSRADMPTLPLTPRNQRVLRYWHEAQGGSRLPELVCDHFFNGELIRSGYYLVTEASDTGYSGGFTDKLGDFFGDYQREPLGNLDLGTLPVALPASGEVYDGARLAYCLPTIVNPDYYGTNGGSIGYGGRVNDYASGAYVVGGTPGASPKVPMVAMTYLLHRLAVLTETTIDGDLFTHPVWSKLLVYNTRATDGAATMAVARHLPELTLEQLLIELRKLPNLALKFFPTEKRLRIDFREADMAKPTALDWSAKAVAGGIKTREQNARLQLGYELDSGDALMKDKPEVLRDYLTPETGEGTGIAKLTSKFSTLLVDGATGLATAKQVGVTEQFGQGASKFAPRLLFWHGVTGGLPRALPTLGGQSLHWNGADGLAARCWARTEANRKGRFYLKKDLILTETDLARLDFTAKVHIDGMDYEVAQLSPQLPIKAAVPALLISR